MKIAELEELIDFHGNIEKVFVSRKDRTELMMDKNSLMAMNFNFDKLLRKNRVFIFGVEVIVDERVESGAVLFLKCKNCGGRSWKKGKCEYCGGK